ncbi:18.5 kDa class I heat shock protein-like [Punica granatum]|uniref:SHSP domain-containing protein n=2 Tax=Punica granatum TaxID=22663 RepID=A0A218Y0Q1_PUNGR|nr:18.5 kDa class I heat shock protein-like [Punica granatum]OWM90436.1 hypothetical protein CDL15_Pgr014739 [Punica granatum]PKI78016.1 hypothetical protein CRG98_001636 [Punica granatum]
MPNLISRSKTRAPEKTRSRDTRVAEELNPSSGWTEDPNNHYLLIDLPYFKKEEIMLRTEGSNQVNISGKRMASDHKFVYFDETFDLPENSDIQRTSWKLEAGLLTVTIPKRPVPLPEDEYDRPKIDEAGTGNNADEKESVADTSRIESKEPKEEKSGEAQNEKESCSESNNLFSWGIATISNNKTVILTAFLAFSLGMFTSLKRGSGS